MLFRANEILIIPKSPIHNHHNNSTLIAIK
jgi:hypothetical protein